MNQAQVYLERYKELEQIVRKTYNLKHEDSISHYLKHKDQFRRHRPRIEYCQDVRNFLVHEKKVDKQFSVEPSDVMIKFIDDLIKTIKNRPKCLDVAIKRTNIYCRQMDSNVAETIKTMKEFGYTHVPIMENDVVQCVFDENALFNFIADEEIIAPEELEFKDLTNYMSLTGRETVSFEFIQADSYIDEVTDKFQDALKKGKRLGMVFITPAGKPQERLTGILTPWDILGYQDV